MPEFPEKRKRFGFIKVVFALALGVIAWWCVDNWLSIKPDYVLRFPNCGELATDRNAYLQSWPFNTKAIDTEDHYLVIERPNVPESDFITTEVRELRTGRLILEHHESFTERLNSLVDYPLSNTRILANAQGTLFQVGQHESKDLDKRRSVCEWNLLTNKRRIIKAPLPGTQYLLSPDSSKLITITCLSPFMPAVIGPPGWANCLALTLLADQGNQFHDLGPVFLRVYSLPDLSLQSSLILPSPYGRSDKLLTPDGNVLVLCNAGLFPRLRFDWDHVSQLYAFQPSGLTAFDLAKGQMRHRIADHRGGVDYFTHNDIGRSLIEVGLDQDPYQKKNKSNKAEGRFELLIKEIRELPLAYYQLSSNRWIDVDGDRVYSEVSSDHVDRILSGDASTGESRIWEIALDGKTTLLKRLTVSLDGDARLINNSDQLVFIRESHHQLPQWIHEVCGKFISAIHWIEKSSFRLVFSDYIKDRELGNYTLRSNQPASLMISPLGNFLVLNTTNETEHEVAVFSLPVKVWSPWWSRCAGVLFGMVLMYWWFSKGKAKTRIA